MGLSEMEANTSPRGRPREASISAKACGQGGGRAGGRVGRVVGRGCSGSQAGSWAGQHFVLHHAQLPLPTTTLLPHTLCKPPAKAHLFV